MLFPYTKNARNCKVTTLVMASKNKEKNIELQFNDVGSDFCFEELSFGDYCFEMFDCNEEMLADDLLDRIQIGVLCLKAEPEIGVTLKRVQSFTDILP